MTRWPVSVFLGVSAVLALLGTNRTVKAEDSEAEGAAEAPQATRGAATYARPGYSLGYVSGHAYVVPSYRAYRRGPWAAAVGVYVGPRSASAAIFAPWGSIPAAFYAASIPLPYRTPRPDDYAGYPYGKGVTAYRPQTGPDSVEPPTTGPTPSPDRPTVAAGAEPATDPEAIPAPQPVDVPSSAGSPARSSGGLINAVPPAKTSRPTLRASPSPPPESGPREF